jgi:hypothetical protein
MKTYQRLRTLVIGAPLDPLSQSTRQHIALAAFLAWVGLGADGLSSSAYGPEEAFRALGTHTQLGLYLALATAATYSSSRSRTTRSSNCSRRVVVATVLPPA